MDAQAAKYIFQTRKGKWVKVAECAIANNVLAKSFAGVSWYRKIDAYVFEVLVRCHSLILRGLSVFLAAENVYIGLT